MKYLYFLFFIALMIGCQRETGKTLPVPPTQGVDIGNAGDIVASEFVELGHEWVGRLERDPISEVTAAQLKNAIHRTRVVSLESVVHNGHEVDAKNYPEATPPRIEVHRPRWLKGTLAAKKPRLALHEYLGILGINDNDYAISRGASARPVCRRSPQVRLSIETAMGRSCERIVGSDLAAIELLSLRNKGLPSIEAGDFDALENVRVLDLSENLLRELPAGGFSALESLVELDLSGNKIKRLTPGAFRGLKLLRSLNLQKNSIVSLESGTFAGLESLRSLGGVVQDLGGEGSARTSSVWGNPLQELRRGFLHGLSSLSGDLNLCPMGSPFEMFAASVSLMAPMFFINRIHPGAFEGLGKVRKLVVCLAVFERDGFAPEGFEMLSGVESIALAGIGLDRLEPEVFGHFTGARELSLRGPFKITAAQLKVIESLPNLRTLEIPGEDVRRFEARK